MAEIIDLTDWRHKRDDHQKETDADPGQQLTFILIRNVVRKLGLMPYDAWLAAGRPKGK